ncbi:MAG: FAD-binding oxidoreductase [Parvularculaceae bacterium]
MTDRLDAAKHAWRCALGADAVETDPASPAAARRLRNCAGFAAEFAAILRPETEADVVKAVQIAAMHGAPLYPVSCGRNWGYGSAVPPRDGAALLDLSRLDRISNFDPETGVVRLGPGVTTGRLSEFLASRNAPFLTPTTGAGPKGSVVGNALDRGYGLTPYTDHFAAVTRIRAVTPAGGVYETPLSLLGGAQADDCFKWGVGPYLDGLFAQGNFGIVTEMSIALAPKPEHLDLVFIEFAEKDLEAMMRALQAFMRAAGGAAPGFNLLNRLRLLSMLAPYPHDLAPLGRALDEAQERALARKWGAPEWMALVPIMSAREVAAPLRRLLRDRLRGLRAKIRILSGGRARRLAWLADRLPEQAAALKRRARAAADTVDILSGIPRETALKLAYWKSKSAPPQSDLDPDRDGCGLLWYAPLVPMQSGALESMNALVRKIMPQFGFEPLITFTALNDRCFDATTPILFDPSTERDAAHACYDALFAAGRKLGFLPYRLSARKFSLLERENGEYWRLAAAVKQAVDPAGVIAPGRYVPAHAAEEASRFDDCGEGAPEANATDADERASNQRAQRNTA